MSLMRCRSCSARFAVGLLRCPQCQQVSELYAVPEHVAAAEEENMPKITLGDGASNALGGEDSVTDEVQAVDEVVDEPEREAPAGGAEAGAEPAKEAAPAPKARKKAPPAKS